MTKYKYVGTEPKVLTTLHKEVKPGEIVESDEPIVNSEFEEVVKTKTKEASN